MSEENNQEDRTPGIISWNELTTQDPEGSSAFYTELLGWTAEEVLMPTSAYTMFKVGERYVAGMVKPDAAEAPPMWINYITVEDLDATISKAHELGAKPCFGPMEIPGKGRFAGLIDPQGAVIAFWEFAPDARCE